MQEKDINIIGGSAFGVFLALSIRQEKKIEYRNINIFEMSNSILNSWNSLYLDSNKFNGGFFGIEMPRANSFKSIIGSDFISENFRTIPNYKLLLFNSSLVPYQYELDTLPKIYRDSLSLFLEKKLDFKKALLMDEFDNSSFFSLIKSCSIRYSDKANCLECAHLFYPWFFPKISFTGKEGISEQNSSEYRSEYLIPKNGIFSDLINKVENLIENKSINLYKNKKVDFDNLNKSISVEEKYIWASSALPLLRKIVPRLVNNLLINKRYVGVCLFKIDKNIFRNWRNQFTYKPSEILTLNKSLPNVSRISFPDHLSFNKKQYLMLEIISKQEKFITQNEISQIEIWLSDVFQTEIVFCDSKLLTYGFNPPIDSYLEVENSFNEIKNNLPVNVPFPYWWPINTSHAVDAAAKFGKNFKN